MSQDDIDLIQGAIDKTLAPVDQQKFDSKLSLSSEFREEYERQLQLLGHLVALRKSEIKEELKELYNDYKGEIKSQPPFYLKTYFKYGVAACLVVAVAAVFILINGTSRTAEELFTEYYEPFHGGPVLRGTEEDSLQLALSAYYNQNYEQALLLLENVESQNKWMLLGNCYLNLDKYDKAENAFKNKLREDSTYEAAKWYLVLLNLKVGDKEAAKVILNEFTGGYYYNKAQEILEEL